jgi:hypothetical protein
LAGSSRDRPVRLTLSTLALSQQESLVTAVWIVTFSAGRIADRRVMRTFREVAALVTPEADRPRVVQQHLRMSGGVVVVTGEAGVYRDRTVHEPDRARNVAVARLAKTLADRLVQ